MDLFKEAIKGIEAQIKDLNEWYDKKDRAGSELSKIKNIKDRIKYMGWKSSLTSKYILTNWQKKE